MKIGFFDSGLGGITILHATRKRLPLYDYIYYGDTLNLPYGDRSESEIYDLTKRSVEMLFTQGAIIVIVACNTASAKTLRQLQITMGTGMYADRKPLGVIIPTVEVLETRKLNTVLLIGTQHTIQSRKYDTELTERGCNTKIISVATPTLVPLIESLQYHEACHQLDAVLDTYKREVEGVVLGCTHYTVLKNHIKDTCDLDVISQDEIIPEKLKEYLHAHPEINNQLSRGEKLEIILTKENAAYSKIIESLLSV